MGVPAISNRAAEIKALASNIVMTLMTGSIPQRPQHSNVLTITHAHPPVTPTRSMLPVQGSERTYAYGLSGISLEHKTGCSENGPLLLTPR